MKVRNTVICPGISFRERDIGGRLNRIDLVDESVVSARYALFIADAVDIPVREGKYYIRTTKLAYEWLRKALTST